MNAAILFTISSSNWKGNERRACSSLLNNCFFGLHSLKPLLWISQSYRASWWHNRTCKLLWQRMKDLELE